MRDCPFPILTAELARRIERAIVDEKLATFEPGSARVGRFGETVALKVPGRPWLNGVYCFGHGDLAHLAEIVEFYATDHLKAPLYLAPMGFTSEVAKGLTAAGCRQDDFSQAVLYGLPLDAPAPAIDGIIVEAVTSDSLDTYADISVEAFEYPAAWREGIKADLRRQFHQRPEFHAFLVKCRGEPAGSGHLSISDDIGKLGGASVIGKFRNKGCHTALIGHRLVASARLGCKLVVGGARFGSASFRNQQRAELRIAYLESSWRMK